MRASSGSRCAAKVKLGSSSSCPAWLRTRGRDIGIRRPPSVTSLGVVPRDPPVVRDCVSSEDHTDPRGPAPSSRPTLAGRPGRTTRKMSARCSQPRPTAGAESPRRLSAVPQLGDGGTSWHASSWRWLLLVLVAPSVPHEGRRGRRSISSEDQQILGQSHLYAGWELHVILDNLNTHMPKRDQWLRRHPNVHFHYIPTYGSWLNQVEIWFSILTRRALAGASFTSPREVRDATLLSPPTIPRRRRSSGQRRSCTLRAHPIVTRTCAIRHGFAEARGQILMILDANLTVPPESLPKFYRALVSGKGDFIGSSHKRVHDSSPSRSSTPWKEAADVLVPANQR